MPYQKQFWENLPSQSTPLNGTRLSHLETQYEQAINDVTASLGDPDSEIGSQVADLVGPEVDAKIATLPLVTATKTPQNVVRIVDRRGVPLAIIPTGLEASSYRETHLFAIWGQSNSIGWRSAPIPKYTNEPVPNLFMYPTRGGQAGTVVPGIDPLLAATAAAEVQEDARGFAIAYARQYAVANPDVRVIVVPNGVGGTGFRYSGGTGWRWAVELQGDVGVIPLYTEMVTRMNTVAALFPDAPVRTVALLGQLGEADAVGLTTEAQYLADHVALAAAARVDLPGASDALYLVGQTVWEFRNERMEGTYAEIDAATLAVPTNVSRSAVALAPGIGYARSTDDTHFTSEGQWLMFKSYVQAHEDALYNL